MSLIKEELLMLGKNKDERSKFNDIPEPVRLEWLIALATAKIYGAEYVKPNLSLDERGIPKSFACGGMADIEFITDEIYCLIEVTLQQDYKQQLNNETTSISDHLKQLITEKEKFSLLIAPRIHDRVAEFFKFITMVERLMVVGLTIEYYVNMIETNPTIERFKNIVKNLSEKMCGNDGTTKYCDYMNRFKINET